MAKKIKLTSDDIDSLTRILDQDMESRRDELKHFHGEDRKEARAGIRILMRLSNKLVAIHRQNTQKEKEWTVLGYYSDNGQVTADGPTAATGKQAIQAAIQERNEGGDGYNFKALCAIPGSGLGIVYAKGTDGDT